MRANLLSRRSSTAASNCSDPQTSGHSQAAASSAEISSPTKRMSNEFLLDNELTQITEQEAEILVSKLTLQLKSVSSFICMPSSIFSNEGDWTVDSLTNSHEVATRISNKFVL